MHATEKPGPGIRPTLVKQKLQGKMFLIPSLITVLGIFCGFLAIMGAFKGNFEGSVKYIVLALILDGLDGRVARRLNATSEFGREFDSLSDIVSFGVAPAVLLYTWAFQHFADEIGMLVSFSLVVCGGARLARFNIDTVKRKHFQGLPIPAQAVTVASLIYFHPTQITDMSVSILLMVYTLLLAGLMVSSVPFISIKNAKFTDGNPRLNLFVIAILVAVFWYQHRVAFLVATTAYVFSGPILAILSSYFPKSFQKLNSNIFEGQDEAA